MICTKCYGNLRHTTSNWYYCEKCDEMFRIETEEKNNLQWYEMLPKRGDLWFQGDLNNFPYIIAHEYNTIFELTKSGQIYGAFFQIKDLIEVIIKFPVIMALSDIYKKDPNNPILPSLVSDTLSLGHWQDLAQRLSKYHGLPKEVKLLLRESYSFYDTHKLVNWRNNIAHGALKNFTDEEFEQDVLQKLGLIKEHMNVVEETYKNMGFFYYVDKVKHDLKGAKDPHIAGNELIHCFVDIEGSELDLYPYAHLDDSGLFVYDTYYSRKRRTDVLNYPKGKKCAARNEIHKRFDEISERFKLPLTYLKKQSSLEEETYSKTDKLLLDKIVEIDDFEQPIFLKNWVSDKLKSKTQRKGIYMLQMERGMGKTTFSRSLDQLSLNKFKGEFSNCSIRGYYVNDIYLYKKKNFILELNELLTKDDKGISEIGGLVGMELEAENPGKELADFLNRSLKEHKKHFKNIDKLVLIIDGLDEIPPKEEETIFDCLPKQEDLDDGVFILLTCRTEEELSPFTKAKIEKIMPQISDIYIVKTSSGDLKANGEAYSKVLTQYIEKNIINKLSLDKLDKKEAVRLILEKAENRFLYLRLIKDLLLSRGHITIEELASGKELLPNYLNNLEQLYGDKYFSNISNLLLTIATAFTPLTLKEISYLVDREGIDTEIVAYMLEIRGFLKFDRSSRGNLISISHKEWADELAKTYKSRLENLLQDWKNKYCKLKEEAFEWKDEIYDGETYLITYLPDYLSKYAGENANNMLRDMYDTSMDIIKSLQSWKDYSYQIERSLHLINNYIHMYGKKHGEATAEDLSRYISLVLKRAQIYMKKDQYSKCKLDYEDALSILDEYGVDGSEQNYYLRGVILTRLGDICNRLGEKVAFKYYDAAIEIFHRTKDSIYFQKEDLLKALNGRGTLYYSSGQNDDALECFEEILALINDLSEEEKKLLKDEIIASLSNSCLIYIDKNENEKALDRLNAAIAFFEKENENDIYPEMRVKCLMNRGIVYDKLNKVDDALEDYNKAIEIAEGCIQKGIIFNYGDYADILINRALIYEGKGWAKEALEDLDKAIKLRSSTDIFKEYTHVDKNKLAITYLNRGNVYINLLEDPKKAAQDYRLAIDIWEKMKLKKEVFDMRSLALVHYNLGNVTKDENYAIKAYSRAIELMVEMTNLGIEINSKMLIEAYLKRANWYAASSKQGVFAKSIPDLKTVIKLFESMQPDEDIALYSLAFAVFSEIARVSKNRGMLEAEELYSYAISLWEKKPDVLSILLGESAGAELFFNRAMIYYEKNTSTYDELAIKDFMRSVELWDNSKEELTLESKEKYILALERLCAIFYQQQSWDRVVIYAEKLLEKVDSIDASERKGLCGNMLESIIADSYRNLGTAKYMLGKGNNDMDQMIDGLSKLKMADQLYESMKAKGKKVDETMHTKLKKNIYTIERALINGMFF